MKNYFDGHVFLLCVALGGLGILAGMTAARLGHPLAVAPWLAYAAAGGGFALLGIWALDRVLARLWRPTEEEIFR